MASYALFDTVVGRCGIAWTEAGVCAVQLPEANEAATVARFRRTGRGAVPGEPTPAAAQAIQGIVGLLSGGPSDLAGVPLDLTGVPDFQVRTYELLRTVPPGTTTTYGELAARLGDPGAAQAVGQAMGANPVPIIVPCHRVLAAGGRMGGFSAAGGTVTKRALLEAEGWVEHPDQEALPFG